MLQHVVLVPIVTLAAVTAMVIVANIVIAVTEGRAVLRGAMQRYQAARAKPVVASGRRAAVPVVLAPSVKFSGAAD